ncbi:MAG TPA: hypothetical protein VGR02_13510 [Thermoanaerobaculia bacterium]|jgi:hypothetical protein|nr:hypothetical protein [Thermoanaerobaculia bacterium]
MTSVLTILIIAGALVLGLALAYIPMRLLLGTIARNVRQFIQRQRDRRTADRETPDRRKAPDPLP